MFGDLVRVHSQQALGEQLTTCRCPNLDYLSHVLNKQKYALHSYDVGEGLPLWKQKRAKVVDKGGIRTHAACAMRIHTAWQRSLFKLESHAITTRPPCLALKFLVTGFIFPEICNAAPWSRIALCWIRHLADGPGVRRIASSFVRRNAKTKQPVRYCWNGSHVGISCLTHLRTLLQIYRYRPTPARSGFT